MNNLGFESSALVTRYGLQIGGAIEIPLVMIGLYFRSRERRENRLRVQALAHTDPLTGVGSHRVLADRLDQLLDRHRRDASLGAVLRVRVGNLAGIANEFGREAAEAAMVRTAECLAREARQGDTVAREEIGDLVLLLDGRMTREQATAAGRNIIAGGLKFSGRLPPGVTLSLQVAVACAPLPDGNVQACWVRWGRCWRTSRTIRAAGRCVVIRRRHRPDRLDRSRGEVDIPAWSRLTPLPSNPSSEKQDSLMGTDKNKSPRAHPAAWTSRISRATSIPMPQAVEKNSDSMWDLWQKSTCREEA